MTEVLTYEALKAKCENLEKQISHNNAKSLEGALKMADTIKELTARVNALAVENACLVKAINDHKNSTHFCERCGEDDPCATDDVCSVLRGIPDTDSAIAAFQAQGVEKFADFLDSPIDGQHCYQHEVGLARHFASTLREAK
ncbi:hypothetical protein JY493_26530 [Serratia marcescens]|nr:hypothetical protein [Serratia marcescens]